MYGRLFSSETGAVGGHNYFYNMDQWTNLLYLQFVNGINRTVFHGYSAIEGSEGSTCWPGHEGKENGIYYTFAYSFKFEIAKDAVPYTVTLSFDALGKPYLIDDFTGKVTEIAAYEVKDDRTLVTLTLVPGQAALIAIDENADAEALHAVSTTEVYFETKKTELSFPGCELAAWKDLPATEEQLALLAGDEPSMADVSGIGTYTTAFEVPESWDGCGARLALTSTGGGLAEVTVNGELAGLVDLRELTLDISDYVKAGENEIRIKVASTLTNRMLQRDYGAGVGWNMEENAGGGIFGSGDVVKVQDYGLQGDVSIIPYATVAVTE